MRSAVLACVVATVAACQRGPQASTAKPNDELGSGGGSPSQCAFALRPDDVRDAPLLEAANRALALPRPTRSPTPEELREGNAIIAKARAAEPADPRTRCTTLLSTFASTGLSDALVPLAEACSDAERVASAWQAIELFDSAPPSSSPTRPRDAARSAELRRVLAPRVPKIVLDVPVAGAVQLDETPVLDGPGRGTLHPPPGRHRLAIASGVCEGATLDVVVREGDRRSIALELPVR